MTAIDFYFYIFMVRVTKRGITPELDKRILDSLLKEIGKIKNRKDLNNFLVKLLTADERLMVKKRLAVLLFLKDGKRKKHIGEILDISRTTINFIKRGLVNLPAKKKKSAGQIAGKYFKETKDKSWYPAYKGKGRWQFLNRL